MGSDNIFNCRTHNHNLKYLISWKEFGPKSNSWKPRTNLENCVELIIDFNSTFLDISSRHWRKRRANWEGWAVFPSSLSCCLWKGYRNFQKGAWMLKGEQCYRFLGTSTFHKRSAWYRSLTTILSVIRSVHLPPLIVQSKCWEKHPLNP